MLLVDRQEERNIFAVCPIRHSKNNIGNGVDRCIDSSRYFVLNIQNKMGRRMQIGLAFNERNDAFDFNTALEDSRREKEGEQKAKEIRKLKTKQVEVDYRMKEGEKIRVSIPKIPSTGMESGDVPASQLQGSSVAAKRREERKARQATLGNTAKGGFLMPSAKDTPSRLS